MPSFSNFGLTFACNDVDAALTELKSLLDAAKSQGLLNTHWFSAPDGDTIAIQAQATYDGIVNNNLVIMSDTACTANANEARAAATALRARLAQGGTNVPEQRPDYQTQPSIPSALTWAPVLLGLGLVAYLFGPAIRSASSPRKALAGYRRKRRR